MRTFATLSRQSAQARRTILLFAGAVVLVLTAACTSHVPLAAGYSGPETLPDEWQAWSGAASNVESAAMGVDVRERARFAVRSLEIPAATSEAEPIGFEYYDVASEHPTPVVVLLPIFNGQTVIPHYFARFFANRGWAVVVIERGRDPLTSLEEPERAVQSSLADYRRVLDWVEEQPELDRERIALFGISLGGMDAVMLTALDMRVRALVVAMAGGDWPNLVLSTRYRRVSRTVDDMAESRGISREELGRQFDAQVETDPLTLAPYVDAERVLMFITRTDAIVPFAAQQRLREQLGEPETLYLVTGHRVSALLFPKMRATAFEFLSEQLAAECASVRGEGLRFRMSRASRGALCGVRAPRAGRS